ncbi:MAG: hypothetical protein A2958_01715 [Candidatus Levybacteria bacterium RIFCSPLOWO2_01_FULL_38_13]|nr:MAG: hypothetical protein A2629_01355 [Candidatus Levybacteria bacterium RIFCSPHIGHO2_01_FULL_41_15]OGH34661.1 MAG: hypothetical protein A2958_01715 [Candidatus Levybacteria bacterium RIFCSPLOWO2_01_FULL_38_13]
MSVEGARVLHFFDRYRRFSPQVPPPAKAEIVSISDIRIKREERVLKEQIARFVEEFGFHRELDMSEEDYCASFPKPAQKPEEYSARFDITLPIDPRIPLQTLHRLAGIYDYYFEALNVVDLKHPPTRKPYIIYLRSETHALNSIEEGMASLKEDEGDPTWREVVLFYLLHYREHPEPHSIVRSFRAASSRLIIEDGELVPVLEMYHDKPIARGRTIDSFYPHRALIRGNIINVAA